MGYLTGDDFRCPSWNKLTKPNEGVCVGPHPNWERDFRNSDEDAQFSVLHFTPYLLFMRDDVYESRRSVSPDLPPREKRYRRME